jgi:hypothetical protein
VPREAAKRADVLLKRLRNDPELVRKDPELDEDAAVKDLWSTFISQELDAQGGIGGEVWTKRVSMALEGHDKDEDAKALTALRDQLGESNPYFDGVRNSSPPCSSRRPDK